MDKNIFKICLSGFEHDALKINFGDAGSCAIDQTPAADVNINPRTGFPYTDMQKIMLQQDLSERRRLLDNMQSYKADFLPDDITDEKAVEYMLGSSMQLPSEFKDATDEQSKQWYEAYSEKIKEQRLQDFLKFEPEKVVEPKKD